MITEMLAELPKPYTYDTGRTAYSFAWGWVQAAAIPNDDIITENLTRWIDAQFHAGNRATLLRLSTELSARVDQAFGLGGDGL